MKLRKNMDPRSEIVMVTCSSCATARPISARNAGVAAKSARCRFCLNRRHGLTGSATYLSWKSMRARCVDPNSTGYKNYGGRGITICDRWLGENGFQNFLADVGERPGKKFSIDRIDVDGNYEPSNCRWATAREQMQNRKWNKLTLASARKIRELCAGGVSRARAAAMFGCSPRNITLVVRGETWKELP